MAKKSTKTQAATDPAPNEEGNGINWPEADLAFLQHHQMPAPAFPLQLLPPTIETLVKGFSETQHLNPAYVGPSILATLSGSIGNRWRIAKPIAGEPLALFVGMVGRPGTGRSTTIEIAQGALQEAEAAITADAKTGAHSMVRSEAVAAHQARQTSRAVKRILQDGGFPSGLDKQEAPSGPPLILSDGTGAGFIDELQHDARGRTLVSAEFRGVLRGLMSGQGERGRTIMLQCFDGPRYQVKLKSGYIVVPALLLTVLAAIHPQSIADIVEGDGLCARFLWTYPDAGLVYELPRESGPIDMLVKLATDLVASGGSGSSGRYYDTIALSEEARDVLDRAHLTFTRGIDDVSERLREMYTRGAQQARRLSGVFAITEAIRKGERPTVLSGEDAERGVSLMGEFFLPMAERVVGAVGGDRGQDAATQLARHLRRLGKSMINSREDILRGRASPLRDNGVIQEALRELQLRGLVQPAEKTGLGRPAQNWHVNPDLLKA